MRITEAELQRMDHHGNRDTADLVAEVRRLRAMILAVEAEMDFKHDGHENEAWHEMGREQAAIRADGPPPRRG